MNILFKSALGLLLGLTAFTAQAQEANSDDDTTKASAVLFKIHDINPVANSDGLITDCDFKVTFYNRTNTSFRKAQLSLGWKDTVSGRYLEEDEKEANAVAKSFNSRGQKTSEINTTVDMPALSPYKQVTIDSSLKTEKCFLLLDNVEFNVNSCDIVNAENPQQKNDRRRAMLNAQRSNSECASLFQYVDSKNPEYYDEFKNISYSEEERQLGMIKKQDTSEIQKTYDQVVETMEKAIKSLESIK